MLVREIGEFKLIERLKKRLKVDSTVIRGSGDDCAVLKLDRFRYQLFTCDMIIEGVDFTLKDSPLLIGNKALSVSISDIAACGGLPRYCVISLGIPSGLNFAFLRRVFSGILNTAKRFKINIVGGDISYSRKIVIDVSMLGVVEKNNLCLRSQAKIGDLIFVTGSLGGSISGKHLKFEPRLRQARFLVKNFKINAMMDISDGLTQDLSHILKQSNVGAMIFEKSIPLSRQARSLNDALTSGEDFELLFTLSRKESKKLLSRRLSIFKPIGEILDKKYGFRLVDNMDKQRLIDPKGFTHF